MAVSERLAGLHGDLPQVQRAELFDSWLDVIFLAHADTAAGEDQVVALGGRLQRGQRGGAVVGHDAEVADLAAQAQQQRAQKEAVAVVDGSGLHGLGRHVAGHHQFVAGGEQDHTRPGCHLQRGQADSGGQTNAGGRQALSFLKYHGTARDILTRRAYPLTSGGHGVDAHAAVVQCLGVFLHHHGIGTRGHGRAGEDARRAARCQRLAGVAGGDALRHGQFDAGGDIGRAYRVAVHRRVVVGRHLQGRDHILRQHAAIGIEGVDGFRAAQWRGVRQQALQRFVERHQGGAARGVIHGTAGAFLGRNRNGGHCRPATGQSPRRRSDPARGARSPRAAPGANRWRWRQ